MLKRRQKLLALCREKSSFVSAFTIAVMSACDEGVEKDIQRVKPRGDDGAGKKWLVPHKNASL